MEESVDTHKPGSVTLPPLTAGPHQRRLDLVALVATFGGLQEIGFLDREDTVMVSSVFAEDDNAADVSRYQLETMKQRVATASL